MIEKNSRLQALRGAIRHLEHGAAGLDAGAMPLGVAALDDAMPDGGLPLGAVHSLAAADHPDLPVPLRLAPVLGFAAYLAGRIGTHLSQKSDQQAGPVLWITPERTLYGPGLGRFGLPPTRLSVVYCAEARDRLWACEQALRVSGLTAVVAEIDRLEPVSARRLQLAAEGSGITALAILRKDQPAPPGGTAHWRIASSARGGLSVALQRIRGGRPAQGVIEDMVQPALSSSAFSAFSFQR